MQIIWNGEALQAALMSGSNFSGTIQGAFAPQAGDTVVATVVFASGNTVHIKLDNGMLVRASLEGSAALAEGDAIRFLVGENDGRRILLIPEEFLEPGQAESSPGRAELSPLPAVPVFSGAGGSGPLAAAAARSGYALTPELAARAALILQQYPQAEAEAAVFIAANEIAPMPENIETARALYRSEFKSGQLLESLLGLLSGAGTHSETAAEAPAQTGTLPAARAGNAPNGADKPPEETARTDLREAVPEERATMAAVPAAAAAAEKSAPETVKSAVKESVLSAAAEALLQPGGTARREDAGPGGFLDGAELKKAVTLLPAQLESLRALAQRSEGPGAETALGRIDTLANGIGFFRGILSFSFVQIPLLPSAGGHETAELYVFRRKRLKGRSAQGETSVVLSLDTAHLGHVEALIRIRGRGVSAAFTAESEARADYLRGHFARLVPLLSQAGFRLSDIRSEEAEKKITPVTAQAVFAEEPAEHHSINLRI